MGELEKRGMKGLKDALKLNKMKSNTNVPLMSQILHSDLTLEGLDCLLEASRQILLEAIEKQSHIDLPRTLDPDKKYSWRQRKEEPV